MTNTQFLLLKRGADSSVSLQPEVDNFRRFLEESSENLSGKNALIGSLVASLLVVIGCQTLVIIISVILKYKRKWAVACEISLMSLGVGTMIADAMVHIIPEALGSHSHGPRIHDHNHDAHDDGDHSYISNALLGLSAIGGMIFVIVAEFLVHSFHHLLLADKSGEEPTYKNSDSLPMDYVDAKVCTSKGKTEKSSKKKYERVGSNSPSYTPHHSEDDCQDIEDLSQKHPKISNNSCTHHRPHDAHDHSSHNHGFAKLYEETAADYSTFKNNKSMLSAAISNACAEILHNIIDGLAIGIAFTGGLTTGISTAICILAHEVPMQFTDYVLFIRAGFKYTTAVMLNTAVAMFVVVGAAATSWGIWDANSSVKNYLLMATAGNFLALAFYQILPEIRQNIVDGKEKYLFIISGISILLGVIVIFMLGFLEDSLYANFLPVDNVLQT